MLTQTANALGLAERIVFTGWLDDPSPAYALSRLFVCPSVHEPLGNVVLEAWAHGVPVVSTRSQGPLELIDDGRNALLVPIGEPVTMAATIEALLKDEAGAAALGREGRATLEAEHSSARVTGAYLELYDSLTGH